MNGEQTPSPPTDAERANYFALFNLMDAVEKELGLGAGFLMRLREGDDWAFVIESGTLIEAALTQAIVEALGRPDLREFVGEMSLRGRAGRMTLAKQLNLLNAMESKLAERVSDVRNDFAHDVRYVRMTLGEYFKAKPVRVEELVEAVGFWEHTPSKQVHGNARIGLETSPKHILWLAVVRFLSGVHRSASKVKLDRLLDELDRKYAEKAAALLDSFLAESEEGEPSR
jgi:hypothetical protein